MPPVALLSAAQPAHGANLLCVCVRRWCALLSRLLSRLLLTRSSCSLTQERVADALRSACAALAAAEAPPPAFERPAATQKVLKLLSRREANQVQMTRGSPQWIP